MPITMFAKDWSTYRLDKFLSLRAKNPFRCFELMDKFDQFVTSFADLDFNGDPCCYFEVVNENTNILMSPFGFCKSPNKVHSNQFKWLRNLN